MSWCSLVDVSNEYYFPVISLDYDTQDVDACVGGVVDHRNIICRTLSGLFIVAKVPESLSMY